MDWTPQRIYYLRQKLGLRQAELAEVLGLSIITINRWEQGHFTPTECDQVLLTLIEQHQDIAERLFSYPIQVSAESLSQRLKRLRSEKGLSVSELAAILYVKESSIHRLERGLQNTSSCVQRLLDWFEHHFEEAAPYVWPNIRLEDTTWTLDRLNRLVEMLGSTSAAIGNLIGYKDPYSLRNGLARGKKPLPCIRFMLWFLETEGKNGLSLIENIQIVPEWHPDRILAVRRSLGFSQAEMARLLGTHVYTINEHETGGFAPEEKCWKILYSMIEQYPKEMLEIRSRWPSVI